MPILSLPLSKGLGKSYQNADYVDLLPVNMLATPKEVLNSSGYLRSFPGIQPHLTASGPSRGVQFNTSVNQAFRVTGEKLYRGGAVFGDVPGSARVSLAHSTHSQAVAANGVLKMYRYDGTVKTLTNWPAPQAQFDIGEVLDVCRARGRYVWVKKGASVFGVTDLEDESHPDRYRPFYSAESQPDGILGCGVWRDFVLMFGSSTIEFYSLTGSADATDPVYLAQPALIVPKGIAGTYCKTPFADSYAFISSQATGAPSIYIFNSGQAVPIATATIEKILRSYTAEQLATGVLEAIRFDAHELLIVHLPDHVLCYDAAASQNGPQWCVLKTGVDSAVYRWCDFVFENNVITVGDKQSGTVGRLDFNSSAQNGTPTECVFYTPLFKAAGARVFDLELETCTGEAQYADKIFLSATADGSTYGREQLIGKGEPFVYDRRVLWRRIGRVRKNIGFKIRVITSFPVTLSDCSIRVE